MAVSAHIPHSNISQSLLIHRRWLSATCHTHSTPIQDIGKRNWDELFILKLNFKYIINLHSVALLHHIIQKLDVTEECNNKFFPTFLDSFLCHESVDLLNCKYSNGSV